MFKLHPSLRNLLGTHGELPPQLTNMPLFVIGNMRSGTTLLVNKLSQHPQLLKIGSELNNIWTEIGGAPCLDQCDFRDDKHAGYNEAYQMSNYFFRFIQDSKSLKRHAMRAMNQTQHQEGRVFYDWANIIPVNKSPHLMNKVGYVHSLFPTSHFIFIIRDIYAQASSMKAHFDDYYKQTGKVYAIPSDDRDCWSRIEQNTSQQTSGAYPPDFRVISQMWIRLNALALKSLIEFLPKQFICVDYNDLVTKQSHVLSGILNSLGLDEKHQEVADRLGQKMSSYKNTQTIGNPLDKWKQHLSAKEVNSIEKVIADNQETYDWIQSTVTKLKL